jgi:hypothetical protein
MAARSLDLAMGKMRRCVAVLLGSLRGLILVDPET